MNVSQIELSRDTRVEGNSDAHHILSNQFQLDDYIRQFGDVEVFYDAEWKVYRVPSLDMKRKLFCEAKESMIRIWGSE